MSEQDNKPKLPQGVLVSGICKGVREDIYNGQTNYYLGLDVVSNDQYGQQSSTVEEISIFGDNLNELVTKARASVGKHCVIAVNKTAQLSQRGRAYMRTNIARDSQILVLG